MLCRGVRLKSGEYIQKCSVNVSTAFPGFLEIWLEDNTRRFLNQNLVLELEPDDAPSGEREYISVITF